MLRSKRWVGTWTPGFFNTSEHSYWSLTIHERLITWLRYIEVPAQSKTGATQRLAQLSGVTTVSPLPDCFTSLALRRLEDPTCE